MYEREYDGIIIGAGPNGLTIAGYLAKAGLKVALLDRRYEIGGGLATENLLLPGMLVDSHAIYHMMVEYAPPIKDFELTTKYDLDFIYPDPQIVMVFEDGSYIAIWKDPQKTAASIRRFSEKDAKSFLEFYQFSEEAMDLFLAPATYVNPLPPLEQAALLEKNPITKRIDELTALSPRQFVEELFEHEKVRALFLYVATMWGLEYDVEGLGYLLPLMINRSWHFRLVKGGSHHLAHLMGKFVAEHGGRIITGVVVKRIILEDGEAKGVELEDGSILKAKKFVCSTLNPHQTFYEFIGEKYLPSDLNIRLKEWKYSELTFYTLHLALTELPVFKGDDPALNNALIYILGYETVEDLIKHFEASKKGELHVGGFSCSFPSVHDPTRVMRVKDSKIRHIGLITVHCAPYSLKNGGASGWYKVRREYAEKLKEVLNRYAPNINPDTVAWDYISSPLDIENKFPDMKNGCFKQGAYLPLQMGYYRPNEYCSSHATPIKNLYVGGASTHSGGMITFGPGFCAAEKIAQDLGLEKWWSQPECVKRMKEAGLILL